MSEETNNISIQDEIESIDMFPTISEIAKLPECIIRIPQLTKEEIELGKKLSSYGNHYKSDSCKLIYDEDFPEDTIEYHVKKLRDGEFIYNPINIYNLSGKIIYNALPYALSKQIVYTLEKFKIYYNKFTNNNNYLLQMNSDHGLLYIRRRGTMYAQLGYEYYYNGANMSNKYIELKEKKKYLEKIDDLRLNMSLLDIDIQIGNDYKLWKEEEDNKRLFSEALAQIPYEAEKMIKRIEHRVIIEEYKDKNMIMQTPAPTLTIDEICNQLKELKIDEETKIKLLKSIL